jgi:hypothetical protein
MKIYGPEFTKETKFEATVVFTSGLIYKYTKVMSYYPVTTITSVMCHKKCFSSSPPHYSF